MIQLKPLIYLFIGTSLVLVIYILIILLIKQLRRATYKRWTNIGNNIINNVIYADDKDIIHHEKSIQNLILKKEFRKVITSQILFAAKNFSGQSSESLKKLYLQLHLDTYVIENINSRDWHIRAKAIQEIGIMKLDYLHEKVTKNTNHKNNLVRAEAQIAIIKLEGFKGLKFLDTVTQPISEWYQMILKRELSQFNYNSFSGIDIWLHSKNQSVVIFALKLVDEYHLFELYKEVELCIKHESIEVRKRAIKTITTIFNSSTSNTLIKNFEHDVLQNKIEIAKSLQKIGTDENIPFLLNQLNTDNLQLKIILTRTIAKINPSKFNSVICNLETNTHTMDLIIAQIQEEISI